MRWSHVGLNSCSSGFSAWSVVGIVFACLYIICIRRPCGLYHIFAHTFVFIFNWAIHYFCSELPKLSALKRYVIPHPLQRALLCFQVILFHSVRYKEIPSLDVLGPFGTEKFTIILTWVVWFNYMVDWLVPGYLGQIGGVIG